MVIENKNWLNELYCWLHRAYKNKENFNEFCVFMSDLKKHGIAYDKLCVALRHSKKIAEDIVELTILTKDNKCCKYRMSDKTYDNLCEKSLRFLSYIDIMIFKDFLEREDCKEYKEFDFFISEQYKTII